MLIVENDGFTNLAIESQCNMFGIMCNFKDSFDEALELVNDRLQEGGAFFRLILIDWNSSQNGGAQILA